MSDPASLVAGLRRAAALAALETRRLLRDRTALSLAVTLPVIQLVLFGYAASPVLRDAPVAIAGDPGASASASRLVASAGGLRVSASALPAGEAEREVRQGRALVALELPPLPDYDHPERSGPSLVRVVVDASDAAAARPALAALEAALWRARAGAGQDSARAPRVEVVRLYNPQARPAWSTAPALAGVVTMITLLMLSALSLVRDREQGVLEGLATLPLGRATLMAGKLGPLLALGGLQLVLVLAAGRWLFELPLRGDLAAFAAVGLVYAGANLALGFAVSAAARTQIQALQGAVFVYLPSMLLSGFIYPTLGMPRWARAAGEALPLTHFIRAARGVLLKGEGWELAARESAPIAAFAAAAALAAALLQRRRGDIAR